MEKDCKEKRPTRFAKDRKVAVAMSIPISMLEKIEKIANIRCQSRSAIVTEYINDGIERETYGKDC